MKELRRKERLAAVASARLAEAESVIALAKPKDTTMSRAIDAKSETVRGLLAVEAVKQAETLAKAEKNDPSVFKTVIDACDKLFGWSRQDGPNTLVQVNYLSDLAPQQVVSCGVTEPVRESITIDSLPKT
jgi:hypothetical protein